MERASKKGHLGEKGFPVKVLQLFGILHGLYELMVIAGLTAAD